MKNWRKVELELGFQGIRVSGKLGFCGFSATVPPAQLPVTSSPAAARPTSHLSLSHSRWLWLLEYRVSGLGVASEEDEQGVGGGQRRC